MRYSVLISCLMLMIVVSSVTACNRKSSSCSRSIECCSGYCRNGICINFGDADDDKGKKNPCRPNPCKRGETCVLNQVQCFTFPCPPIGDCVTRNK